MDYQILILRWSLDLPVLLCVSMVTQGMTMKIRFMKRLTGADEVNFTAGNGGMCICLIVNTSNEMYILPQTLYVT